MQETRKRRASATEGQLGRCTKISETGATPDALAPFVPYLGLPDALREPWADDYLRALAANGKHELAAAAASIHSSIPREQRDTDRAFAAEMELALEYYRDSLEAELRRLGRAKSNPLPYFGLLKSERPARWIERTATLNLSAELRPLPPPDAMALLRSMLRSITPATKRMLAAGETLPEAPAP